MSLVRAAVGKDNVEQVGLMVRALSARVIYSGGIILLSLIGISLYTLSLQEIAIFAGCAAILFAQSLSTAWLFQARNESHKIQKTYALQSALALILTIISLEILPAAGVDILSQALAHASVWIFHLVDLNKKGAGPKWKLSYQDLMLLAESRWIFYSIFFIQVYLQLDILIVAHYVGIAEAGEYRVAALFAASVQSVLSIANIALYPRLVEWEKNKDINRKNLLRIFLSQSLGLFLIVGFIAILADKIIPLLYGARFANSVPLVQVLLASKAVLISHGVFSMRLWAGGRDRTLLAIVIIAALISACSNLILVPTYGAKAAAYTSLMVEVFILVASLYSSMAKRA